jgi:Ca2+-binding EF-hand superfamily protein
MEQAKLFSEEHIKSVFRMIDSDNNGYVERAELLAVL